MSIGYEENDEEEEEEEFTSNTQSLSISLPAWLVIAIDEKRKLAKRSTWITEDLEKMPKYAKERKRILREMNVGAKSKRLETHVGYKRLQPEDKTMTNSLQV